VVEVLDEAAPRLDEERPARSPLRNPALIVAVVAALLGVVLLLRLGAQDRGGPAHMAVDLPNGAPATLYIPARLHNDEFPLPPPIGRRPPLVIVAHGYAADQQIMSTIARSLAHAGYAALTFDFRGHGANTAAFRGDLDDDLVAAMTYAERSPYVDPSRIGLLGHSMGAFAVLDFATRDPRPKAVLPLSGGEFLNDANVPPHVLLMAAAGDPKPIRDRQTDLERQLQGRTDVTRIVVGGKNHVTELWSNAMLKDAIGFFDRSLGITRSGPTPGLHDPRLPTAVLYLLVAAVLVGFVGMAAGRLVPAQPSTSTGGAWIVLAAALLLTMPLMAVGAPGLLPLSEDSVVTGLALAGALLWTTRWFALRQPRLAVHGWFGDGPWLPLRTVLVPGLAAAAALFVLLAPLGAAFHRLIPTPERLVLWAAVTVLVLPFFAGFEQIVRRGRTWPALGWGVLGRALIVGIVVLGVAAHVFPPVVAILIPIIVVLFVLLEIFGVPAYAAGANPALLAVVDAVFIAWVVAIAIPVI
jgi:dienelactone hydrolase